MQVGHGIKDLVPCEKCGKKTLNLVESRKNPKAGSRRRRYECLACNHKVTRYEVSEAFYKQSIENERIINQLKLYIDQISGSVNKHVKDCSNCSYNEQERCSFDLPEYLTEDGEDCSYWKIQVCQPSRGVSQRYRYHFNSYLLVHRAHNYQRRHLVAHHVCTW